MDSIRASIGRHDVPIGILYALTGIRREERRRVETPPTCGMINLDHSDAIISAVSSITN